VALFAQNYEAGGFGRSGIVIEIMGQKFSCPWGVVHLRIAHVAFAEITDKAPVLL
jgi:hypothetical protein